MSGTPTSVVATRPSPASWAACGGGLSGCFQPDTLEAAPAPWTAAGGGHPRARRAGADALLSGGEAVSLLQRLPEEKGPPARQIITKHLFSCTQRTAGPCNRPRESRPGERTVLRGGRMDNILHERTTGAEVFPPHRRAHRGLGEGGAFAFFRLRLRGGALTVNGREVRRTEADAAPREPGGGLHAVPEPRRRGRALLGGVKTMGA